ncbi:hypothetical protein MMC20_001692 [Loxospora ochrophaea]|nr:hypothetical protein [Loxospora ochrophaea]
MPLTNRLGYVGRILLHSNPFQSTGFNIQISLLIIAPAFLSAGVYLTLKHLTLALGPSFSRIQPRFYTWIFITCDIFSLVLQAAGGGIAASAKGVKSKQESGADLMMAGIVWQVFTLLVFALLAGDYFVKVYQNRTRLSPAATSLLHETRFRLFLGGLVFAFLAIFTRCAYRIAELSHGWKSPIMQNEVDFIVLDGTMVALAVLSLTVFHPGWSFPLMQMQNKNFAGANANGKHIADSRDGDLEAMAL